MFKLASVFIFLLGIGYSDSIPEDSLYQIESAWNDQNAADFQFKNLKGSVVVMAMLYTSCPHACPMIVGKIQKVEAEFKKNKIQNYKIVLASFDSKNDSPARLKKFAAERKLNLDKWILITAKNDSIVRELAVLLGVSYKPVGGGDFSHSNVLTVLNKSGQIISQIDKLSADVTPLIDRAKDAHKK